METLVLITWCITDYYVYIASGKIVKNTILYIYITINALICHEITFNVILCKNVICEFARLLKLCVGGINKSTALLKDN